MATLDEKILESLRPGVDDLGRLQRKQLGEAAMSLPAAMAAGRRGGPMAAIQTARQFHSNRVAGSDPMIAVSAKQSLLKDMAAFIESKDDAKLGIVDKLSKLQGTNDKMLDIFKQYVSGNQSASTALASARVGLVGDLADKYADVIIDRVTGNLTQGSGRANAAYKSSRDLLFGGPNPQGQIMGTEAMVNAANNILYNQGLGPEDQAAAWSALEAEAASRGGSRDSIRSLLEMASNNGSGEAAKALQQLDRVQTRINSIEGQALALVQQQNAATFRSALGQHGGMSMDQIVRAFDKFQDIYDPNAGPEALSNVMSEAFEALKPPEDRPDLLSNYQKLLDNIDDDNLDPATTFGQARERLFADPAFKQMMEQKGFQTPGAALKWLRQTIRAKRRKEQMADAKLMRDDRAGINQPDSAAAAGGDLGREGEVGSGSDGPLGADIDLPEEGAPALASARARIGQQERHAKGDRERDEAFGVDPNAPPPEDITQPFFAIDPETREAMRWDPEAFRWDKEHPELDEFVATMSELGEAELKDVVSKMGGSFINTQPTIQAQGSKNLENHKGADLTRPQPAMDPPEGWPAEEAKERKPFLLPNREMIGQGVKNLLFAGPQQTRSVTGAVNKRLAEMAAKRKEKKAKPPGA